MTMPLMLLKLHENDFTSLCLVSSKLFTKSVMLLPSLRNPDESFQTSYPLTSSLFSSSSSLYMLYSVPVDC